MIENIKNAIYQNLNELFVTATLDEMTGDLTAYKGKLKKIAKIAEVLGVDTEIITVAINIKTGSTIIDSVTSDESTGDIKTGVIIPNHVV